jgi:PKD repeat protein
VDIVACADSLVFLSPGNEFIQYTWNTGSSDSIILASSTAYYSVKVIDSLACANSDTIHVTINDLPSIDLADYESKCRGESITLQAPLNQFAYLWNTSDTTSQIVVNNSGTYTVEVTDAFNCKNTDSVVVVFHDLPVVNLGVDIVACADSLVFLSPGNEFIQYTWNTGSSDSIILASSTAYYSVKVIDSLACANSDTIHVTINDLPSIDLVDYESKCQGETITLQAPLNQFAYLWNTNDTTSQLIVNNSGTYTVEVTNEFNCKNTDSTRVEFLQNPISKLASDTTACMGDTLLIDGGTFEKYIWSDSSNNRILEVTNSGLYTVQLFDKNQCSVTDSIDVVFYELPLANFSFNEDKGLVSFFNTSNNANAYLWYFGDSIGTSQEEHPVYVYNENGFYQVILIAYSNHCGESQADSTVVISGVSIDYDEADFRIYPNPTNDRLIIERETNISKKLSIEIFNSNGELVISKKSSGKNIQISLASFTNGIYIVKILESDKILTFKVLKN